MYLDLFLVPQAQLIIMFPKAAEAIIFGIVAFMVRSRGGKTFKDQYMLNRALFVGFLGWALCMSLDVFLYMLAPQDFNPNIEIMMAGYDFTHSSLFLANVLRDISMGGGYIFLWSLFIAAYIIRNGEAKTKQVLTKNPLFIGGVTAYGLFFIFTDEIFVWIRPGQDTVVNAVFSGISLLTLFVTISIYVITAIYFRKTASIGMYSAERSIQKRIIVLSSAVLLFAVILVYWLVKGIMEQLPDIGPIVLALNVPLEVLGHGIWTMAPVLMFLSIRKPLPDLQDAPKMRP